MGQKVRPTGFRTGIMVDWLSHWYASKQDFSELLVEDHKIRKYIKKRYKGSGISKIRIQMSGRLGGAEMARQETSMVGSIPLSTLRARIDFGFTEAKTAQGHIGIKVWINNGDYLNPQEDSDAANAQARQVPKKSAGRRKG